MKILVTGGSGRLGRSVVATLRAAGHEVSSVDAAQSDDTIQVDLTDRAVTRELFSAISPEAVIHLAAIAVPFSAPENVIYETNTRLAFTVLEAAVDSDVRLVLAASSPTVIGYGSPSGWQPTALPIDETHPVAPWNAYSLSKQAIEDAVQAFTRAHSDTTFGVFRPCFVISPEEWQGAPTQQGHTVLDRLRHPELAAVALFNYVDARDAADFVLAWLDRATEAPNGSIFFVGAEDALAIRPLSELLPYAEAAALTGTRPAFSSAKAEHLLGWRPSRSWRTELAEKVTI
jgi:UDP-glucose 4-epimerase